MLIKKHEMKRMENERETDGEAKLHTKKAKSHTEY